MTDHPEGPYEDTPPSEEAFPRRPPLLSRRQFVKRSVQVAIAGALVPATLAQVLPAITPDSVSGGGAGPIISRDPKTNAKKPATLADLDGDAPVVYTGEYNFLPAVVYKVKRAVLEASTKARGYNTAMYAVEHPDEPGMALLAYDGKCKHLGCTVGWDGTLGGSKDIPDYNGDGKNDGRILCPCHQGQYDIFDLALNQPGTPPPEPLNVIEFDVLPSWTDPDTGESYRNVIYGTTKILQHAYRDAEANVGEAMLDLSGKEFRIRKAGWSEA